MPKESSKDARSSNPPPAEPASESPAEGRIRLDETLNAEASQRAVKRGKEIMSSEHPKRRDGPVGEVVDLPRPSRPGVPESLAPDTGEVREDLAAGVGVFSTAVDTITSSLLMLIGKMEDQLDRHDTLAAGLKRNNNVSRLNSALGILLLLALGYCIYVMQSIAHQNVVTIEERRQLNVELKEIKKKLAVSPEDVLAAVRQVQARQGQTGRVEIVADDKGGAKLVVRGPEEAPPASASAPAPPSPAPPSPAPPPPPAVEIPIELPPGSTVSGKK